MNGQPKVRPVRVRKVLKVRPQPTLKPVSKPTVTPKPVVEPRPVCKVKTVHRPVGRPRAPDAITKPGLHLDPWMLDSARVFHYGNALRWFGELGLKQIGIRSDLSVEIHTYDGRVEVIPAIILVTRDRRYAFNFVGAKARGENTNELVWEMDQYDKEFVGFAREWETRD